MPISAWIPRRLRSSPVPSALLASTDPQRLARRRARNQAYLSLVAPFFMFLAYAMVSAPQSQFLLRLVCREQYAKEEDPSALLAQLGVAADGNGIIPPPEYCKLPHVQRVITMTTTAFGLCTAIPAMIMTSINGRLSDNPRIGRKPFLIIPILSEVANLLLLLTVAHFQLPSPFLIIGHLIMGWTGGASTFMMALFAQLAASVKPSRRTFLFTLLELSLLGGSTLGPLLMAATMSARPDWPLLVVWIAVGVLLLTGAAVAWLIDGPPASTAAAAASVPSSTSLGEETSTPLSDLEPRTLREKADGSIQSVKRWFGAFTIIWSPWNRTRVLLVACGFLINVAVTAHSVAFIPYTYRKFGWTAKEDGYFQSVNLFCKFVTVVGFLPFAYRRNRGTAPPPVPPTAAANRSNPSSRRQSYHSDATSFHSRATSLLDLSAAIGLSGDHGTLGVVPTTAFAVPCDPGNVGGGNNSAPATNNKRTPSPPTLVHSRRASSAAATVLMDWTEDESAPLLPFTASGGFPGDTPPVPTPIKYQSIDSALREEEEERMQLYHQQQQQQQRKRELRRHGGGRPRHHLSHRTQVAAAANAEIGCGSDSSDSDGGGGAYDASDTTLAGAVVGGTGGSAAAVLLPTAFGNGLAAPSRSTSPSGAHPSGSAPVPVKPGMPMEARLVQCGFLAYVFAFLGFGLATEGWQYLMSAPLDAPGTLAMPLMRSLLTQTAPPEFQGALLGAYSSMAAVAHIVAPVGMSALYSATVGSIDGLVYFFGAGCWAAAFGLALFVQRKDVVSGAGSQ
ncbi:hypothetical protein BC828DRAFT_102679 [Blastocladiella britannica]|nr:hypothetical protein BC828DRAFT_102679 [Blastocladiella britannica]